VRTVLALTALVLGSCTLALAQDKEFDSKDGKFKAKFPGEPKTIQQKAGGIDLNISIVDRPNKGGFAVIYSDMPPDVVKATPPDKLLEGGEKGLVDNFKAVTSKEKGKEPQKTTVKFGDKEYPARVIYATKDELHMRVTLVLAGNRLYQVFVVGPKDVVEGKEADDFIKSFVVTP